MSQSWQGRGNCIMPIIDQELERLIHAPKVNCKACMLLRDNGFCQYHKIHRNYILRCNIAEDKIHILSRKYNFDKGTDT